MEYAGAFNDLLQKYSAQLARSAKAEKTRIAALSDALEPSRREAVPHTHKAELRSRAAALRGLGIPSRTYRGPDPMQYALEDEEKAP